MVSSVPYSVRAGRLVTILAFVSSVAQSQPHPTRFQERFDSTPPPLLPPGWVSSFQRTPDGDVTLSLTGAHSPPGCAVGSNAVVPQWLASPALDLRSWRECALRWMERRSATHDGSIVVEASIDGGVSFTPLSGDTLRSPGSSSYVERNLGMPEWCWDEESVTIRWTMPGDGTGATGTIRFDDVSVTGLPRRDLSIRADAISPPRPLAGDEVWCRGFVVNAGYEASGPSRLVWGHDIDGNGAMEEPELLGSVGQGPILPGDSAGYAFSFRREGSAPLTLVAVVRSDSDMAAGNDTVRFHLPASIAPSSVIINEIMYDPLPGRAEYVELYNRSGETIDLGGWRLTDREDDSTSGRFGADGLLLSPGEYLLCSPDTTMPFDYADIPPGSLLIGAARGFTLNNSGDRLILTDESGGTIDRVDYVPEWHTPALEDTRGRSLERIGSEAAGSGAWNWGTSAGASGGTPGYRNSLSAAPVTRDDRLSCSPNPFSPDGDPSGAFLPDYAACSKTA